MTLFEMLAGVALASSQPVCPPVGDWTEGNAIVRINAPAVGSG